MTSISAYPSFHWPGKTYANPLNMKLIIIYGSEAVGKLTLNFFNLSSGLQSYMLDTNNLIC